MEIMPASSTHLVNSQFITVICCTQEHTNSFKQIKLNFSLNSANIIRVVIVFETILFFLSMIKLSIS